jgi:hypothetical protein
MSSFTGFLFAEPSFAEGLSRLFDWGGMLNEYNTSASGAEADRLAMMCDWAAVGDDFLRAVEEFTRDAGVPKHRVQAIAEKV